MLDTISPATSYVLRASRLTHNPSRVLCVTRGGDSLAVPLLCRHTVALPQLLQDKLDQAAIDEQNHRIASEAPAPNLDTSNDKDLVVQAQVIPPATPSVLRRRQMMRAAFNGPPMAGINDTVFSSHSQVQRNLASPGVNTPKSGTSSSSGSKPVAAMSSKGRASSQSGTAPMSQHANASTSSASKRRFSALDPPVASQPKKRLSMSSQPNNQPPLASQLKARPPLPSQSKSRPLLASQPKNHPPLSSQGNARPLLASQSKSRPPLASQSKSRPPLASQSKSRHPLASQSMQRPPLASQSMRRPPLASQYKQLPPLASQSTQRPPVASQQTRHPVASRSKQRSSLASQPKKSDLLRFDAALENPPPQKSAIETGLGVAATGTCMVFCCVGTCVLRFIRFEASDQLRCTYIVFTRPQVCLPFSPRNSHPKAMPTFGISTKQNNLMRFDVALENRTGCSNIIGQ